MEIRNGKTGTSKSSSTKVININFSLDDLNVPKESFWNAERIKFLINAKRTGIGTRKMAQHLGRSRITIRDKLQQLKDKGLL
jgi:predicted transcriptional regulator